ncbi:MAG: hypothetical protein ACLTTU_14670 [Bilophila wadsworthia]
MDRNEIYTGKARLVNRGNGIVLRCATKGELAALLSLLRALFPHGGAHEGSWGGCGMRYVIGDSARLVTPYRGYSWVTIIGYEGDGYCVELTSGLELVVREDELEDV